MNRSSIIFFVSLVILFSCNSNESTKELPEQIKTDSIIKDSTPVTQVERRDTLSANQESKEEDVLEINSQNLLGDWAMGDGFVFNEDGTFNYFEPDCYEHYEGNWKLNENQLILVFKKLSCKNEKFETHYEIITLTKHYIVLKDSNGDSVKRFRN